MANNVPQYPTPGHNSNAHIRDPGSHDCPAARAGAEKEDRGEWITWEFADYMVSVQKKASFAWEGEKKGGIKVKQGYPRAVGPLSPPSAAADLFALFMDAVAADATTTTKPQNGAFT